MRILYFASIWRDRRQKRCARWKTHAAEIIKSPEVFSLFITSFEKCIYGKGIWVHRKKYHFIRRISRMFTPNVFSLLEVNAMKGKFFEAVLCSISYLLTISLNYILEKSQSLNFFNLAIIMSRFQFNGMNWKVGLSGNLKKGKILEVIFLCLLFKKVSLWTLWSY